MPTDAPPPRSLFSQLLGLIIVATAGLGIVLSVAGLIATITLGARVEVALMRELERLDLALTTSSEGLRLAGSALGDTKQTLSSLSETFVSVSGTISETQPIINTVAELTRQDLPATIVATRDALSSAQETAVAIDRLLSALNLFGLSYNPALPLSETIANVSTSLEEVPGSLEQVAQGLIQSNRNLATVANDLDAVTRSLEAIAARVGELQSVVDRYGSLVGSLQSEVAALRTTLPGWLLLVRLGVSLLFLWFSLAQFVLLIYGWEWLGRRRGR